MARRRRDRGDSGASAVEFALVMPVLLAILLGIIDYGLWFNDSLSVRQGVREAARQGVVNNITGTCAGDDLANFVCQTEDDIGAVTGDTYVMVDAPDDWGRGEPLLVCAMVKSEALVGFVPIPEDGLIKSKTSMSIEVDVGQDWADFADTAPAGGDWSWCD